MHGFEAAGGFDGLAPHDLERYAWSLLWTGPPAATCLDAFERAEDAHRRAGDGRGTARAALEQARMHSLLGNDIVATSCWIRAIEELGDDHACPEYGLAHALAAYARLIDGAFDEVTAPARVALRVAQELGEPTVEAMTTYVLGQQRLVDGTAAEGMELLDRSISIALHDDVHPMYAGIVYCGVLWACRLVCDWDRASEWHDSASRWCQRQRIFHFPAHLHVHRSELARIRGRFMEAETFALAALEQAGDWSRDLLAWAHYQLGETRLCLGDLTEAEGAFDRADQLHLAPEPGRSRLLLLRGRPESALQTIERTIDDASWYALSGQVYTLPVGVSVAVALGRFDLATAWCERLGAAATRYGTRAAAAASNVARGEIALARGDADDAVRFLSEGVHAWTRADAPYDAACARVLLARAYAAADDLDGARQELTKARTSFAELDATADRERIDRFVSGATDLLDRLESTWSTEPHVPLTRRQREIAALVARGYSNQRIADELVISRYTAETHVKHILSRLSLSSRSEIAVWAAQRGLGPAEDTQVR